MTTSASTHDLLGPLDPASVRAESAGEQADVEAWLGEAPFAVVRRAPACAGLIPVGVRGRGREQRCAGWIAEGDAFDVMRPEDLRVSAGAAPLPVYRALAELQRRWAGVTWEWGPVGSVGFSLASGCERVHSESDLDVLLRLPEKLSSEEFRHLIVSLDHLACRVDVQVQTPFGFVALLELARSGPVLLRMPAGIALVRDPWLKPAQPLQRYGAYVDAEVRDSA